MSEALSPTRTTDKSFLDYEYFGGGNLYYRWKFYEHTIDGIDFHQAAIGKMGLTGAEAVLDLGCGQGLFLEAIQQTGHEGQLVGLDMNAALVYKQKGFIKEQPHISFVLGDASIDTASNTPRLPFRQGSFDVISSMFMLYHVDDPQAAVSEASTLLKPDGKMVIATSGPTNKQQHRYFERLIAEKEGVAPPGIFAESFNTDVADEMLPALFEDVEEYEQLTEVHVTYDGSTLEDYINSLKSMKNSFQPYPVNFSQSVVTEVIPRISQAIDRDGAFIETVHRKLYVCQGPVIDLVAA